MDHANFLIESCNYIKNRWDSVSFLFREEWTWVERLADSATWVGDVASGRVLDSGREYGLS